MKRNTWLLLSVALLCLSCLLLCGCNKAEEETAPHTHAWGNWNVVKEATCTADGEEERTCSCGEKETQPIEAVAHLVMKRAEDGLSYVVKSAGKCDENCDNSHVVIPDSYRGLPVTAIEAEAFSGCETLRTITIPDTVTRIGSNAFKSCINLTSITIPDSVTHIGSYAFAYCKHLTSVVLGQKVERIGYSMFTYCSALSTIVIPRSVKRIDDVAFYQCGALKTIYYGSDEADWRRMYIGSNANTTITSNKICYYSEEKPTTSGNYWHYNENGNPVKW